MRVKAVLFDMDGVLIESHAAWVYIFNKALKKFEGKTVTVKEFDKYIWSKAFDKTAKKYFKVPIEKVRAYYREIYKDYRKRLKVIKGTKEALSLLKSKNLKLAVVSNTQRNIIKKVLKDVSLIKFFDIFTGGDDVVHGKPEPDILYKGLELLNLKKQDILFVGDTKWDRMAAKKAGVKFIGFKIKGDKKINNLKELLTIIK